MWVPLYREATVENQGLPHFGFGTSTREDQERVFVTQEHNKTLFGGALGVASSRLSLVRASGGALASKEAVCGGAATEWTGWSHDLWPEVRNDVSHKDLVS